MLISLIYLISIIWINFNGKVFYNLYIYSDAYVLHFCVEVMYLHRLNMNGVIVKKVFLQNKERISISSRIFET